MIQIIYVAIAGAIGALCRWGIGKVVDTEQTIRQVLPKLDEMITDGMVTLEKVDVIRYVPKHSS